MSFKIVFHESSALFVTWIPIFSCFIHPVSLFEFRLSICKISTIPSLSYVFLQLLSYLLFIVIHLFFSLCLDYFLISSSFVLFLLILSFLWWVIILINIFYFCPFNFINCPRSHFSHSKLTISVELSIPQRQMHLNL